VTAFLSFLVPDLGSDRAVRPSAETIAGAPGRLRDHLHRLGPSKRGVNKRPYLILRAVNEAEGMI